MHTKPHTSLIGTWAMGMMAALLALAACQGKQGLAPTLVPPPATATLPPTPLPTLSLEETSVEKFVVTDFGALHSPVAGDTDKYVILGNLPVSKPAPDLSPELAAFLGRWEGYIGGTPVKNDRKTVLVVQEITLQGGKAIGWSGTNLQYPDRVGEIHFRVIQGDPPAIEWQIFWPGGVQEIDKFTYDRDRGLLVGWSKISPGNTTVGPHKLSHDQSFYVYKDYTQYLAGKHIYAESYQSADLQPYGQGYLLYLPEGYEADTQKTWPLILFLHGYGDRGDNPLVIAKASPFMYIREKGPLPFIIAAPLLTSFEGYSSFPEAYLDGVLAEVRANYRIDAQRIYLTGLSMGGEATWRFALHQPDTFAAIAPLSAYLNHADPAAMKSIKDLPVWAIHGADDTVFSVAKGQQPVDALKEAGGNVQFTVLQGHDHDTWTDTYSDPKFYDWLLKHEKPAP